MDEIGVGWRACTHLRVLKPNSNFKACQALREAPTEVHRLVLSKERDCK